MMHIITALIKKRKKNTINGALYGRLSLDFEPVINNSELAKLHHTRLNKVLFISYRIYSGTLPERTTSIEQPNQLENSA